MIKSGTSVIPSQREVLAAHRHKFYGAVRRVSLHRDTAEAFRDGLESSKDKLPPVDEEEVGLNRTISAPSYFQSSPF
jgi:hypothetical protein